MPKTIKAPPSLSPVVFEGIEKNGFVTENIRLLHSSTIGGLSGISNQRRVKDLKNGIVNF